MSRNKTTPAAQQADHTTDPGTTPQPTTSALSIPDNPDDPLTLDEEEAYSLLCSISESNAGGKDKPAPKSRVEFARLAVRARGVRYLLRSFEGLPPSKAMKSAGISWGDLTICRLSSPDFERVFQFCRREIGERLTDKALEAVENALDGRNISNSGGSLARFVLERLRRDDYGDPRYKYMQAAQGGGGGGGVVYHINVINTAQNPQTSPGLGPSLCGECVAIPAEAGETTQKSTK